MFQCWSVPCKLFHHRLYSMFREREKGFISMSVSISRQRRGSSGLSAQFLIPQCFPLIPSGRDCASVELELCVCVRGGGVFICGWVEVFILAVSSEWIQKRKNKSSLLDGVNEAHMWRRVSAASDASPDGTQEGGALEKNPEKDVFSVRVCFCGLKTHWMSFYGLLGSERAGLY